MIYHRLQEAVQGIFPRPFSSIEKARMSLPRETQSSSTAKRACGWQAVLRKPEAIIFDRFPVRTINLKRRSSMSSSDVANGQLFAVGQRNVTFIGGMKVRTRPGAMRTSDVVMYFHLISREGLDERVHHHRVLGLVSSAPLREVRRAFLRLITEYHPDRHTNDSSPIHRYKTILILQAWQALK